MPWQNACNEWVEHSPTQLTDSQLISQVANQFCMVTMNHRHDSTDSTQNDVSHENHFAAMLIPATLSDDQCGVLHNQDDWEGQICASKPSQHNE